MERCEFKQEKGQYTITPPNGYVLTTYKEGDTTMSYTTLIAFNNEAQKDSIYNQYHLMPKDEAYEIHGKLLEATIAEREHRRQLRKALMNEDLYNNEENLDTSID